MDDGHGVLIEARTIPVPTSISAHAREYLRDKVAADGMPHNARVAVPAADDTEGWIRMQAAVEQHYAQALAAAAGRVRAQARTLQLGTATVHLATPVEPHAPDAALIELHGGALVFGGGRACRIGACVQADLHGLACYGVDYRMPPAYPYPAALDDCLAVYRAVLARHDAARVVISGRSAGGNLAVAMLQRARDEGLPLPAGLVLLSPEVDLTESGDSFQVNRTVDVVLPGSLMAQNLLYAGGADLADPRLSPLFGRFDGFPPTFLQSGTRDLFLSNTVRLHRALRRADVDAQLHVFEAMPHGGFNGAPEDEELAREVAAFVRRVLGQAPA